jgi:hypothetical protein
MELDEAHEKWNAEMEEEARKMRQTHVTLEEANAQYERIKNNSSRTRSKGAASSLPPPQPHKG